MGLQNSIYDLSNKERWGFIGIAIIALLLIAANIFVPRILNKKQQEKYSVVIKEYKEISAVKEKQKVNFYVKEGATPKKSTTKITKPKYIKKKAVPIDINSASIEKYKSLPGIGNVYAGRIVKFRAKIGGFYSVNQISEVYGIEDSLYNIIKPYLVLDNINLKYININVASFEELKEHPYISDKLANQIINYREKVEPYLSADDLLKLYFMNDDLLAKLRPYIAI